MQGLIASLIKSMQKVCFGACRHCVCVRVCACVRVMNRHLGWVRLHTRLVQQVVDVSTNVDTLQSQPR
jgi:hypothetical protein